VTNYCFAGAALSLFTDGVSDFASLFGAAEPPA